jgi:hypothetical protein
MATGRRAVEGKSQASLISSIMGSQPARLLQVAGPATFVEAPEGGSCIVLVDVEATDADAALAKGGRPTRSSPGL